MAATRLRRQRVRITTNTCTSRLPSGRWRADTGKGAKTAMASHDAEASQSRCQHAIVKRGKSRCRQRGIGVANQRKTRRAKQQHRKNHVQRLAKQWGARNVGHDRKTGEPACSIRIGVPWVEAQLHEAQAHGHAASTRATRQTGPRQPSGRRSVKQQARTATASTGSVGSERKRRKALRPERALKVSGQAERRKQDT